MRLCRKYYRRLFLSGRLYTLLFALHCHLRLEAGVDISLLLQQRVLPPPPASTSPSGPASLPPGRTTPPCSSCSWPALPLPALSVRKNRNALGIVAGSPSSWGPLRPQLENAEPQPSPPPQFQPLEQSLALGKWRDIEKDRAAGARQLAKRLRARDQPASLDSSSFSMDNELGP